MPGPEFRVFKDSIVEQVGRALRRRGDPWNKLRTEWKRLQKEEWFHLAFAFRIPLYFKNGKVRRWDCSNFIKVLEDCMMDLLGVDDRHVLSMDIQKEDSGDGSYGFALRIAGHPDPTAGAQLEL